MGVIRPTLSDKKKEFRPSIVGRFNRVIVSSSS